MSDLALGRTQRFGLTNSACLKCGEATEAFSAFDKTGEREKEPRPGDITMCIHCGHLQAIEGDRASFRELSSIEHQAFDNDPRVLKLRAAQRMAVEHGGVKSVEVFKGPIVPDTFKLTPDAGGLTVKLHRVCVDHFGGKARGGFTESDLLDIAAAGATLVASYLSDLPYKRRLEVVSMFVDKMLDSFKGKGPGR